MLKKYFFCAFGRFYNQFSKVSSVPLKYKIRTDFLGLIVQSQVGEEAEKRVTRKFSHTLDKIWDPTYTFSSSEARQPGCYLNNPQLMCYHHLESLLYLFLISLPVNFIQQKQVQNCKIGCLRIDLVTHSPTLCLFRSIK